MERIFLIDVLAAATVAGVWYFFFTRYNHRRGIQVLRRVEAAGSTHPVCRRNYALLPIGLTTPR